MRGNSLLLQGLEGRDGITIIVDDTSSVWSEHAENLLAVERYVYFPSSRRQFGMKTKSLLEINRSALGGSICAGGQDKQTNATCSVCPCAACLSLQESSSIFGPEAAGERHSRGEGRGGGGRCGLLSEWGAYGTGFVAVGPP